MAQQALGPGTAVPRRRALFGLLDADGWGWASVKAFVWLIFIIFILGYLPDRAYYLTVGRTVDLGVLVWSPINLCPPSNETLPCPAPVGALVPWQPSPPELNLPGAADRRVGHPGRDPDLLHRRIGRADREVGPVTSRRPSGPATSTSGPKGPTLPEPRADASVVFVAGSIYVIGGRDAVGRPDQDRLHASARTARPARSASGAPWTTLALPDARSGAAAAITPDGLLLVGGRNADGPVATTFKTLLNSQGALGAWSQEQSLNTPQADATAVAGGRLPVAVRRQRRQRPDGHDPARGIRPGGRRRPARQPRRGQAHPLGRQRLGQPAGTPHERVRLGRQRRDLPGRRQRRRRSPERALLGGPDERRRPARMEAPGGKRPADPARGRRPGHHRSRRGHRRRRDGRRPPSASSVRANTAPLSPFFQLGLVGATVPA